MWGCWRNDQISECSKLAQKEYKTGHDWVGKVILWKLCKKLRFDFTSKWYMHNPAFVLKNETNKLLWDLTYKRITLSRRGDHKNQQQKKRTCKIVDYAIPADHRIKLKEYEKKDKYLDLGREWKKCGTWKWQLYHLLLVLLVQSPKDYKRDSEIRGRVETMKTTALLRTARILRRVLETWGDLLSLKFQWKTIRCRWCEKLSMSK